MDKYEKMASEILEILKYMPEEKKNMIPKSLISRLESMSSPKIVCNIDPMKSLEEQQICNETKMMMVLIYRDYWANPEEKQKLNKIIEENSNSSFDAKKMFEKLSHGG